jgi:hypothetical protein
MTTKPNIRKVVTYLETIRADGGRTLQKALKKCATVVVIHNPYAGVYQEDLTLLMEYGEFLGDFLTRKAVETLSVQISDIHSFGKACIVGLEGEHEHAAAIMHPRLGAPLRSYLKAGKAIIPSVKKLGPAGATLDIPLLYKDAMLLRSHYDALEVRVPDAPHPDEILVAIALTTGGRPHARIGGFSQEEVRGINGLD